MANVAELQLMVQRLEAENRELVGQVNQGGGQQNEDRAAERAAEVRWRQQQRALRPAVHPSGTDESMGQTMRQAEGAPVMERGRLVSQPCQ